MKKILLVPALLIALAACGGEDEEPVNPFSRTYDDCGHAQVYLDLDEKTMFFDTAGDAEGSGDHDLYDALCTLRSLEAPEHVINHIGNTSSLQGMQSDSWGDFTAEWTYHPDQGLDIVFKYTPKD